jgi:hypothetical protein
MYRLAAACMAGLSFATAPAVAQSINDTPTPAGYCVVDINTRVAQDSSTPYRHNGETDLDGVIVGYPLEKWDVSTGTSADRATGTGYMNMSVELGKITEQECLTNARLVFAAKGIPVAPSSNKQDNPWSDRGGWASPHFWQSTGNARGTGILYTQKMNAKSTKVITGISLNYGIHCGKAVTGLTTTCLGTWKPEPGGNKYYSLATQTSPYTYTGPALVSMIGQWVKISECFGACTANSYQLQIGVTDGRTNISGTETQKQLSASVAATFASGASGIANQSVTMQVGGSLTDIVRTEIQTSFSKTSQETLTQGCDPGAAMYQYQTTAVLSNQLTGVAKSPYYRCSNTEPGAANINNLNWLRPPACV